MALLVVRAHDPRSTLRKFPHQTEEERENIMLKIYGRSLKRKHFLLLAAFVVMLLLVRSFFNLSDVDDDIRWSWDLWNEEMRDHYWHLREQQREGLRWMSWLHQDDAGLDRSFMRCKQLIDMRGCMCFMFQKLCFNFFRCFLISLDQMARRSATNMCSSWCDSCKQLWSSTWWIGSLINCLN